MLKNRVNSQSDTPITEHELRVLCNNTEIYFKFNLQRWNCFNLWHFNYKNLGVTLDLKGSGYTFLTRFHQMHQF